MTHDDVEDLLRRFPPRPSTAPRDAVLLRADAGWNRARAKPWIRIGLGAAAACLALDLWASAHASAVINARLPATARAPAHAGATHADCEAPLIAYAQRMHTDMIGADP